MTTLNDREILAVKVMAASLAALEREDIAGAMMKCGVFRILDDKELVDLSSKLELTPEERIEDWKRSQEANRLLGKEEMYEMHGLLHALWSKAVGKADYDKTQWKRLEELVGKGFRTILGPEVDRLGYIALIAPKREHTK